MSCVARNVLIWRVPGWKKHLINSQRRTSWKLVINLMVLLQAHVFLGGRFGSVMAILGRTVLKVLTHQDLGLPRYCGGVGVIWVPEKGSGGSKKKWPSHLAQTIWVDGLPNGNTYFIRSDEINAKTGACARLPIRGKPKLLSRGKVLSSTW